MSLWHKDYFKLKEIEKKKKKADTGKAHCPPAICLNQDTH